MQTQSLNQQEVQKIWSQAKEKLRQQLSPAAFNTWILTNPLVEIEIINQTTAKGVIATPTAFHATNLKKNLYSQLKSAVESVINKQVELTFKIHDPAQYIAQQKIMSNKQPSRPTQKTNSVLGSSQQQLGSSFSFPDNQSSFDQLTTPLKGSSADRSPTVAELFSAQNIQATNSDRALTASRRTGLRPDYKFKTFAVSGSNEMAHAAATAVSKHPGQAYNPLFLYGGVGVGKTHLMQAIGHHVLKKDPSIKIIYCTGEEFTNEIIDAIRNKRAIKFKKRFRTAQILMIDDIQFIAGKNAVQEEFFHTFNAVAKMSSQIILTSDRPPQEINLLEDRLRSRFEAGLMVDIQQPSSELRTAIVLIKAKAAGVSLPISLAEKIAKSVSSARKIEGTIAIIRSEVELKNKEVNEDLIDSILTKENSLTNASNRIRLKPQKVIQKVCEYYQLKPIVVKGKKRNKDLVRARHMAMFLLKKDLDMSYVEIGKWFSNRDHTSIMHAKRKIEKLIDDDEAIIKEYQDLKTALIKISV